jgi:membrane-bound serine protease (ClpP class)
MPYWISTILLLILATTLAVLEVFFPSAGVLAFLSAAALISAIVMAFYQGFWFGVVAVPTALGTLIAGVVLGLKYWPKTAMGKRILLTAPDSNAVLPDEPERDFLRSLVGRTGRAKSKLLLSGVVTIDGRTLSAESEGMPVEEGQPVRVIQVRGTCLVVRPVNEEPLPADPLQQTYEDPFDEGGGKDEG